MPKKTEKEMKCVEIPITYNTFTHSSLNFEVLASQDTPMHENDLSALINAQNTPEDTHASSCLPESREAYAHTSELKGPPASAPEVGEALVHAPGVRGGAECAPDPREAWIRPPEQNKKLVDG
jgi:hypothetical protein